MLSDQLKHMILAGVLSTHPAAIAAFQAAQQREVKMHQARALGLDAATISRMTAIAQQVGPMTMLPNADVWHATWQSMMESAARGESPIPDDEPPIAWADHVWTIMHGVPVRFEEIHHIVALTKALSRARDANL